MRSLDSGWLVVLAAAASAQTFIVDVTNGPGTNFTSIVAAVAAVPSGSTLVVRPGFYGEFSIQGKALTVIGGPLVYVTNNPLSQQAAAIEVANTTPGQTVVVTKVVTQWDSRTAHVHDCLGPVVIEDVVSYASFGPYSAPFPATIRVERCAQVMLRALSTLVGQVSLLDANVVLEHCSIDAPDAFSSNVATAALAVTNGSTTVVACTFEGGSGIVYPTPSPDHGAIEMINADLRILGATVLRAGQGNGLVTAVPAITGTGSLRIDPIVALNSFAAAPIAPAIAVQTAPIPWVRGQSTMPGGALSAAAVGPTAATILGLGLPGPPLAVPGIADAFWIDPATAAFVAIGVPQPFAPLSFQVAVPNNPVFRGVVFAWQSAALLGSGLEASNPTLTLVY